MSGGWYSTSKYSINVHCHYCLEFSMSFNYMAAVVITKTSCLCDLHMCLLPHDPSPHAFICTHYTCPHLWRYLITPTQSSLTVHMHPGVTRAVHSYSSVLLQKQGMTAFPHPLEVRHDCNSFIAIIDHSFPQPGSFSEVNDKEYSPVYARYRSLEWDIHFM